MGLLRMCSSLYRHPLGGVGAAHRAPRRVADLEAAADAPLAQTEPPLGRELRAAPSKGLGG